MREQEAELDIHGEHVCLSVSLSLTASSHKYSFSLFMESLCGHVDAEAVWNTNIQCFLSQTASLCCPTEPCRNARGENACTELAQVPQHTLGQAVLGPLLHN